jgi:hypothetical protein
MIYTGEFEHVYLNWRKALKTAMETEHTYSNGWDWTNVTNHTTAKTN